MRELKVMTLGRQLSLVHSSKNSSASFQSPAFSQALIRLLYVITLRSHPAAASHVLRLEHAAAFPVQGQALASGLANSRKPALQPRRSCILCSNYVMEASYPNTTPVPQDTKICRH